MNSKDHITNSGPNVYFPLLISYFRIALRKIRRQPGYTIINISGLGVGLACCAIMMLWVSNEKSFDRFHTNRDSVYRLIKETRTNGEETLDSRISYPLAETVIRMQPLKDVHLKSNFGWDLDNFKQGNSSTITLFSVAALGVLLLAIINFINLATAKSAGRAKEVGLRKINGARRTEIISQLLGESVFISLLAFLLSLVLVKIGLPLFNNLANRQIEFVQLFEPQLLLSMLAATFLTGILSGSFPAFFLSSFQPSMILKGPIIQSGIINVSLRRILVVIQFTITIFLITLSAVVNRQIKYTRSADLGMNTSNIIITEGRFNDYQTVKNALLSNPGIDILLMPVLVAMIASFSMVGYQSLRAAMANPVDSLRHE